MNTRWLGIMLAISSLIVMLNNFRTAAIGIEPYTDTLGNVAYLLWGIGGVCGVIGLIRQNALGTNAIARSVGLLPLLGFVAFILSSGLEVVGFIRLDDSLYMTLSGVAWIAMLAGMLVTGILTIAARTWSGWRRFVPLVAVVMFPVALGIAQTVGSLYVGAFFGYAPWMLLGYVIATAETVPALRQSVTA
jgi:hypothetical protein